MAPAIACAPSRTAAMVAAYRARATRSGKGLCNDPWAGALACDFGARLMAECDLLFPSMELLIAVRTAFFDGQVRYWTAGSDVLRLPGLESLARPVDQVVVVGAGLDSRAARLGRTGVTFYEVDHPSSVQYKKERVRQLPGYPDEAIAYVGCDLEQDDLVGALSTSAFRPLQPAVFLCEGLVPYLSECAVRRMLAGIAARCHESSIVVFDHVVTGPEADARSSPQARAIQDRMESLGESLRFGRGDALSLLHQAGFAYSRSVRLEDVRELLAPESGPSGALRFQQLTIASRRSLTGRCGPDA